MMEFFQLCCEMQLSSSKIFTPGIYIVHAASDETHYVAPSIPGVVNSYFRSLLCLLNGALQQLQTPLTPHINAQRPHK